MTNACLMFLANYKDVERKCSGLERSYCRGCSHVHGLKPWFCAAVGCREKLGGMGICHPRGFVVVPNYGTPCSVLLLVWEALPGEGSRGGEFYDLGETPG